MNNKDNHLMFESYSKRLSEADEHCKYAEGGCECDECKECHANATKSEDAEEELGPDPKEADELEVLVKRYSNRDNDVLYILTKIWDIASRLDATGVKGAGDILDFCSDLEEIIEGQDAHAHSEDAESSSRYDDPYREKENHKYDRGEERSDREYKSSRSTWYVILPNGKIFTRDGKPVPFVGQDAANKAAMTMSKQPFNVKRGVKIQDFKLTTNPDVK